MTARSKATGPGWVVQLQPGPHPVWVAAESGLASTMYYQFAYRFESEMDAIVALQAAETQGEFPLAEVYRQVPKPSATGALLCAELEGDIAPNVEVRDVQLNAEIQPAHDTARCKCGYLLIPALYDRYTMPASVPNADRRHLRNVVCRGSGHEFRTSEVRALQAWWSAGAHEQKLWMQQRAEPARPTLKQLRADDAELHPWGEPGEVPTERGEYWSWAPGKGRQALVEIDELLGVCVGQGHSLLVRRGGQWTIPFDNPCWKEEGWRFRRHWIPEPPR